MRFLPGHALPLKNIALLGYMNSDPLWSHSQLGGEKMLFSGGMRGQHRERIGNCRYVELPKVLESEFGLSIVLQEASKWEFRDSVPILSEIRLMEPVGI